MKDSIKFLGVLLICCTAFGAGWFINDSKNHKEAQSLYQSQVRALEMKSAQERLRSDSLLRDLETQTQKVTQLESELASHNSRSHQDLLRIPHSNKPFPVRTFLGTKFIGNAELIFAGAKRIKNPDGSEKIIKEPVVRLPNNYKSLFTTTTTNIIEKEISRTQNTYNSNYYNDNYSQFPHRLSYGRTITPTTNPNNPSSISPSTPPNNPYHNNNPFIRNDEISKPRVH